MFATKDDIKRLETIMLKAIGQNDEYVSEEEFLRQIGRSKAWAKHARNGTKKRPAIFKCTDWHGMNGRSIMYKKSAIDRIIKQLS